MVRRPVPLIDDEVLLYGTLRIRLSSRGNGDGYITCIDTYDRGQCSKLL